MPLSYVLMIDYDRHKSYISFNIKYLQEFVLEKAMEEVGDLLL